MLKETPSCSNGLLYTVKAGDTLSAIAAHHGLTVGELVDANPYIDPSWLVIGQVLCIPAVAQAPVERATPAPTPSMQPEARIPSPQSLPKTPAGATLKGGKPYEVPRHIQMRPVAPIAPVEPTAPPTVAAPAPPAPAPVAPAPRPEAIVIPIPVPIPSRSQPLPECPACPQGFRSASVMVGQNFCDLLLAYDVSYGALRVTNPTLDPNGPIPGQKLCIPAKFECEIVGTTCYVIAPGDTLISIAERFVVRVCDLLSVNPYRAPSQFIAGELICVPIVPVPV